MSSNKVAGGPGSGVKGENTQLIEGFEHSPIISIGKRKAFMKRNKSIVTKRISLSRICYKGQKNFVPAKLNKFVDGHKNGETWMWEKPIDVILDKKGKIHLMDGHHRWLAAIECGIKKIKANVYMEELSKAKTAAIDIDFDYDENADELFKKFNPKNDKDFQKTIRLRAYSNANEVVAEKVLEPFFEELDRIVIYNRLGKFYEADIDKLHDEIMPRVKSNLLRFGEITDAIKSNKRVKNLVKVFKNNKIDFLEDWLRHYPKELKDLEKEIEKKVKEHKV